MAETAKKVQRRVSEEIRSEINRLVNVEKGGLRKVSQELGVPIATVGRIAGVARGAKNYLARHPQRQTRFEGSMPRCPFPTDVGSLRDKTLSVEEKYFLGCLVNVERLTAKSVAQRYDISEQVVYRISRKTLRGEALDGQGGTPAVVDDESNAVLKAAAAQEGPDRPTRKMMRELIAQEATRTQERRRTKSTDGSGTIVEKIVEARPLNISLSKTTLAKYLRLHGF